jgi:S-(hydroxymethyl)glutathione dehydrogenase/alcohol dehydrogenase
LKNWYSVFTEGVSLPHASFISYGFSTGFGGAWKEAQVEKGSTVAVLGLGAVGLGVCTSFAFIAD